MTKVRACQRCEDIQPEEHFDQREAWNEICIWCLYNMPDEELEWYVEAVRRRYGF